MKKSIILFGSAAKFDELAKAHVNSYTRRDGSVVAAHEDGRRPAAPKPPAKKKDTHPLVAAADKHDAAAENHEKLAAEKGKDHPDYKTHRDAATAHARAAYHARQATDLSNEDFRSHLKAHDDSAKQAANFESGLPRRK